MSRLESLTGPELLSLELLEGLEAPEFRERGVESRSFARGALEALWIAGVRELRTRVQK